MVWLHYAYKVVMSIGNQIFGIPRKYRNQIGIWYFCPNFLGIFLVFYRNHENFLRKIWFNIGIYGRIKNRFGIWYLVSVAVIFLVLVWFWFAVFRKVTSLVQSAQSRTRSSEIAFLRSLKIVQLIGKTRTEPHYDSTQKRNLGRKRPRLRTLYAWNVQPYLTANVKQS